MTDLLQSLTAHAVLKNNLVLNCFIKINQQLHLSLRRNFVQSLRLKPTK
jgi:hypothetical protein